MNYLPETFRKNMLCHRLRKNSDKIIVKFSRRNNSEQTISVKNDLKKAKMQDIGLTGNQPIFIITSLCLCYRMLRSKCKRLRELGNITNFYISRGTRKVTLTENSSPKAITHTQDFTKCFHEVVLLPKSL